MSAWTTWTTHAQMFGLINALRSGLAAVICPNFSAESFDYLHNTDTSRLSLQASDFPADGMSEAVDYEPAHVRTLQHVFRIVGQQTDLRALHLVDIGCGKGRTLLVGSQFPFREITGIERAPVTAAIARRNVSRFTGYKQFALQNAMSVHEADATTFPVPSGDLLVVAYNPFFGATFERFIQHLDTAARAEPSRTIWLAYINPWACREWLGAHGTFQLVDEFRVIPRTWTWSLWRQGGTR